MNGLAAVVVSGGQGHARLLRQPHCTIYTEVVELGSVVNGLHGGTPYLVVPKIEGLQNGKLKIRSNAMARR